MPRRRSLCQKGDLAQPGTCPRAGRKPAPSSPRSALALLALEDAATWYGLAGKLVGKALVEGHHLGTSHLNRILLKHLASEPIGLEDLKFVDASLYASFDAGPTRALKRGVARALPRVASTR